MMFVVLNTKTKQVLSPRYVSRNEAVQMSVYCQIVNPTGTYKVVPAVMRKIADVRKEIRQLESELTHLIIVKAAKNQYKCSREQLKLARRIDELKEEYPNWERTQKVKAS